MLGQEIRFNKLLRGDQNCVISALDAGGFFGPYEGLIDLRNVSTVLNNTDGILIENGMIGSCRDVFLGNNPPVLITRLNWNSDYCFQWKYNKSFTVKTITPSHAISLGVDVGIASLSVGTGNENTDSKNVKLFTSIIEDAEKIGLPIIGEIYPPVKEYSGNQFHKLIYTGCRIAAELGANAIKTFYTDDMFHEIVESLPVPVFALGGDKWPKDIYSLRQAEASIKAGARGVVFGRNLYQAKNPGIFLKALKEVVRGKCSAAEAVEKFGLSK
jgi:DhnA family fructose-bisphosphate aldolase class Ia